MINFEKIVFLIQRKKYEKAIAMLKNLLSSNPAESEIFFLLSKCYSDQKKYSEGRECIKKAIEIDTTSSTYLNQFAEIEIEEKNYNNSLKILADSLRIDSIQEEVFLLKSRIFLEKGNLIKAVENSKKALELDPNNSYSKNVISFSLILDKKYKRANNIVSQSLNDNPLDSFSLFNLSLIKYHTNQIEESKQILQNALSNDPQNEGIRETLKQVIVSQNRIANLFFKLSSLTLEHKRMFRFLIGGSYRLIMIIGILLYISTKKEGIENFLLLLVLAIYSLLLIPYKIVPQIFTLTLYLDDIGKFLITKKDKIITTCTSFFFVIGISLLASCLLLFSSYIIHVLVIGMSFIFLSGLIADFNFLEEKRVQIIWLIYFLSIFSLVLVYSLQSDLRFSLTIIILIFLWVYPFMVKSIGNNN